MKRERSKSRKRKDWIFILCCLFSQEEVSAPS